MKHFKKSIKLFGTTLIFIFAFVQTKAQVITRVLYKNDQIENYIPCYNPDSFVPTISTPLVNAQIVLENDKKNG